ncbi:MULTISPECIES: helix-turn-helix transcriptional regulator [Anaerotruncus]|jgi:predicted transcriptional regulator YheO|uniref:helix-turn-helix transcriptional regulator n=1 Tax=Anaerotruncus TaxID=244127 RepID=UPI000E50C4B8|nr:MULTISPECIES: PAS domain-containing protein [Anaerotruncus]RGX55291.1 hypothetical protein DWV16_09960 [Anaerotruncus sp. AF02-27]
MKDQELMQVFVPLVDFLAEVFGESCEVILHDLSNPEHSVIALRNGHLSGRAIGSSMTDLAFRVYSEKQYEGEDFLANYRGYSGGKTFVSSTFYIKNEGRLIGMLCINSDTSQASELRDIFNRFMRRFEVREDLPHVEENLGNPVVSMVHSLIDKAIQEAGISPARMTKAEKVQLVQKLNAQGILLMKGAVAEIAEQLSISEPTVYRYLNGSSSGVKNRRASGVNEHRE